MVDFNPLHWGKKRELSENDRAVGHALAVAEEGKSTSEVEREKQLAENGMLMVDPELNRLITGLCVYERPEVNAETGEAIYEQVTVEEDGRKQTVTRPKMSKDYITKNVSLRILASPLIRGSYLDPIDAQLGRIRTRCILRRIKMKMTEADYEQGGSLIIDSVGQILDNNYSCAKNGRMALVTKVTTKSMEVRVGRTSEAKS